MNECNGNVKHMINLNGRYDLLDEKLFQVHVKLFNGCRLNLFCQVTVSMETSGHSPESCKKGVNTNLTVL